MQLAQKGLVIVLCLAFATPATAQQSPVLPPGAIDRALADQAADTAAKRQAIDTALQQTDVQRAADRLGIDLSRAQKAVGTLDGIELDRLAAQAQLVNDEVAGGQTVRLNLLWLIIGLLILIIIILVA